MTKAKNVTFSLPTEIMERYKYYAQNGNIPSVNAGVKEALEEYSIKIEKENFKKEMAKAAKDPLFMRDLKGSMRAFEVADSDSADSDSAGGENQW